VSNRGAYPSFRNECICIRGLARTMSGKAIFSIIMIVFWSIMAAWETSNLFAAHEDVKIAEQDVEKAKAEYEQAQREVDAIIDDHLARAGQ
jgi:hypothetical protein